MSAVRRKLALIVEDEPIIAMGLAMQLQEAGFEKVESFGDCSSALSYLNQPDAKIPDLSILDVQLRNGETSFDVARYLHDRGGAFFLLSGYGADNALMVHFPQVRALSKPVNDDALFSLIDEIMTASSDP